MLIFSNEEKLYIDFLSNKVMAVFFKDPGVFPLYENTQ